MNTQLPPPLTTEQRTALIEAARAVRLRAYAPFSNYLVGAALLSAEGKIYSGCNVENSSYPATICAERSAVVSAVSDGIQQFHGIAVVTRDGGSPCGICRQVMFEFAPNMPVLICDEQGTIKAEQTVAQLLPLGFRFER